MKSVTGSCGVLDVHRLFVVLTSPSYRSDLPFAVSCARFFVLPTVWSGPQRRCLSPCAPLYFIDCERAGPRFEISEKIILRVAYVMLPCTVQTHRITCTVF